MTRDPNVEGSNVTPDDIDRGDAEKSSRYNFDKVADALAEVSPSAQQPSSTSASAPTPTVNSLWDIPLEVDVVVGHARMPVSDLMKLGVGDTLTLDRCIGDPVEIIANGTTIAWGALCAVDDSGERFGVRLTKLCGAAKAAPSARRTPPKVDQGIAEEAKAAELQKELDEQRVA